MKNAEIVMIPVTDQKKAKEFYLSLGLQVLMEAPGEHGETWLQMGFPGQQTSIALAKFAGIIYETPDIAEEIRSLTEKGVSVGKIDEQPWGKFAWLKDPDGNGICLHELPKGNRS